MPPKTIYDWEHYLAVVQRKPRALCNGAPFLKLPPAFRRLQDDMLRRPKGDCQPPCMQASLARQRMVDILATVLRHDEQAVLTAMGLSVAKCVPARTHVLNILHRLVDGKVIKGPSLDTPQALVPHRAKGKHGTLCRPPRPDCPRPPTS